MALDESKSAGAPFAAAAVLYSDGGRGGTRSAPTGPGLRVKEAR